MSADFKSCSNFQEETNVKSTNSCNFKSAHMWLPLICGVNFLLDICGLCLSIHSSLTYIFDVFSVFSFLCFVATLSGTREKQSCKIKLAMGWIIIKMNLIVLLFIFTSIAFIKLDWVVKTSKCKFN